MAAVALVCTSILTVLSLLYLLWQFWQLGFSVRVPGVGRIFFLWGCSAAVWMVLAIAFFVANTLHPSWAGDSAYVRVGIRFFFGVYLLVATLVANRALYRWRKQ